MRILIDSLIGLMLVAVVVCVVVLNNDRKQGEQDVVQVKDALVQLDKQAEYRTALQSAMAGQDTMLVHLHQEWFGDDVPTNVLLDPNHPWIDLAPPGDLGIHPPDPVATHLGQAGFWYNPTTGIFRARVKPTANEGQTLALYNQINGTSLGSFEQIPDPSRQPIAHTPGSTPTKQYASMANRTWSEPEPTAAQSFQEASFELVNAPTKQGAAARKPAPDPDTAEVIPDARAKPGEQNGDGPAAETPAARPTLGK